MNKTQQKRIWEIDCVLLDAALAASFDWREMANLLQGEGICFSMAPSDDELEMLAQNLLHRACHKTSGLALKVENLMNQWHSQAVHTLSGMKPADILKKLSAVSLPAGWTRGGLFWALGVDGRPGLECLRRRFCQRFQIQAIRELERAAAAGKTA